MATLANGSFPFTIPPLTNITPFSYRDGYTYLEVLYGLRDYVTANLVPEFDTKMAQIIADFNDGILNAETVITGLSDEWETRYTTLAANFTAEVRVLSEAAIGATIADTASSSHATVAAMIDAEIAAVDTALRAYADTGDWEVAAAAAAATSAARTDFAAADTAVRAEFAAADTALRADLATKNRVEAIARLVPVDPVDVVFIGDSYFNGYQPLPTPYINPVPERTVALMNAQGLGIYRIHNYAQAAGGYDTTIGGGDTYFDTEVNNAVNDPAITNCRLIVVGGGRNDSGKDVYAKAKALYSRLKTKWPNAKIVVFPMWSNEKFGAAQRITFNSIYAAAKDSGAVYDTNSLWVNALTDSSLWIDTVAHPKDVLADRFAYALFSLIQGGSLPAQSTQLTIHSSSGVTVGVAELNGLSVSVSLRQFVGANYDGSYDLAEVQYPVLRPGVDMDLVGVSGGVITIFTIYTNGNVRAATTATAGNSAFNGTYPLGL